MTTTSHPKNALEQSLDHLNLLIKKVEDVFRDMKSLVQVTIGDLGWWKHKSTGKWQIVHVESDTPLMSCPLQTRLEMIVKIPELHAEIIKQKELLTPLVLEKIAELEEFLKHKT